jgi:hypothetical protein
MHHHLTFLRLPLQQEQQQLQVWHQRVYPATVAACGVQKQQQAVQLGCCQEFPLRAWLRPPLTALPCQQLLVVELHWHLLKQTAAACGEQEPWCRLLLLVLQAYCGLLPVLQVPWALLLSQLLHRLAL